MGGVRQVLFFDHLTMFNNSIFPSFFKKIILACQTVAILLCLPSCGQRQKTTKPSEKHPSSQNEPETNAPPYISLTANGPEVPVRDKAGLAGEVIATLQKGDNVRYAGKMSDFSTPLQIQGVQYNDPWLQVTLSDGRQGWVYGGSLRYELADEAGLSNILTNKRLNSFFGNITTAKMQRHRRNFSRLTTADGWARTYHIALELRDTLNYKLNEKISLAEGEPIPDLFWLKDYIPGFVVQLVADGSRYFLFIDYKQWGEIAPLTMGNEDDRFTEICYKTYPMDSVEYFYKAWFKQTWAHGGSSLLGRGIHKGLLDDIQTAMMQGNLFQTDLMALKRDIVNDITDTDNTYWDSKEKILQEIDSILDAKYTILTAEDFIAIRERRRMFEAHKRYGIQLNLRTGVDWE